MATINNKFLVKNGLAVGGASGIDVINSSGVWIGATGNLSGATGQTGSQGIGGATGPQGVQGIQGIQGAQGASGIQGVQGASGSTGLTGATGIDGATGIQGASGSTGIIGASGINGSTGVQGASGIQGASGASGVNGATGTQGPQGNIGATGTQGIQGVQGASGSTGLTGATGEQGIQGASGATGIQGVQGASGATGLAGATGIQGVQGASGATGITGASGATGTQGASGATGIGATGLTGATGIQGPTGQSSSYYNYLAKTGQQSGDPGSGHINWNNATLLSSTQLQISHITSDTVDVDIFLALVNLNDILIIQEANDSTRFQKWQVNGTPVAQTGYFEYPVTLLDSGGTAIANNNEVILAIVSTPIDGATGVQGSTGAQGASGATGTQGASGSTGPQGIQGASGATGIQGASGSIGLTGATGIQGVQGASGATGLDGATGLLQNWVVKTTTYTAVNKDMIVANTSSAAFTITLPSSPSTGWSVSFADPEGTWATNNLTVARNGSTIEGAAQDLILDVSNVSVDLVYDGSTWQAFTNIGPIGASGVGATGALGASGATGIQGVQGTTGPQGIQGASGAAGSQGNQGASGATGTQGVQGTTGAQGVQGATGISGATGTQGVQGTTGPQGIQGASGATGAVGGQGIQGVQGASGATGSQGVQGASGATGFAGATGVQGASGATGSQGGQGIQGASGVGATGAAGATGITGASGTSGGFGASGIAGSAGATGAAGASGISNNGATGVQGASGATGSVNLFTAQFGPQTGATGATGSVQIRGGLQVGTGATGATGTITSDKIGINTTYFDERLNVGGGAMIGTGSGSMRFLPGDGAYPGGNYIQSGANTTIGTTADLTFSGMKGTPVHMVLNADGGLSLGKYFTVGTVTGATGATGVITATNTIISTKSIGASGTQGAFAYGTLNYPDGNIMGSWSSNVNNYNQLLLQNTSSGTSASTNFVVSNDQATNSTWYGELGMNSSLFNTGVGGASGASGAFIQPNMVYVAAQSSDLAIGTFSAKPIHFVVNNGANDAMTIDSVGNVIVNPTGATGATGAKFAIGTTAARDLAGTGGGAYGSPELAIESSKIYTTASIINYSSAGGPTLSMGKSKSSTLGTLTTTQNGDLLGAITFDGVNTTPGFANAANIIVFQDGAAGATRVPGKISFSTSNGINNTREGLSVNAAGGVNVANYLAVGTQTGATGATGAITATGLITGAAGAFTNNVGVTGNVGTGTITVGTGATGATGSITASGRISATSGSITTGATGYVGATGSIGAPAGYFNNLFVNGVAVSGGGSTTFSRKTTTYTAVSGDQLIADTTSAGFTITLPATPSSGSNIRIVDGGNFNVNNLTVARNGSTIEGASLDFILDVRGVDVSFVYDGTTWQVYANVGAQGASGVIGASGTIGVNGATGPAGASGAGSSITITDDTTTDASYYPMMSAVTSGIASAVYTASSEMYFNPSTGTLSATQFNSLSDEKFKDNFTPIVNSLELINNLNPGSFTWKSNGKKAYGVLAQETELILPEIVDSYDGKKTVSYDQIIPILIQAVKDLQKEIIELKERHDNT